MKILKWRHLTSASQLKLVCLQRRLNLEYAFKTSQLFNHDQRISIHGDVQDLVRYDFLPLLAEIVLAYLFSLRFEWKL